MVDTSNSVGKEKGPLTTKEVDRISTSYNMKTIWKVVILFIFTILVTFGIGRRIARNTEYCCSANWQCRQVE